MEVQAAAGPGALPDPASDAAARAVLAGESRQPCKLRMRVAQVKADLIRQREIELLLPSTGPGTTEVLRLLRPATKTEVPAVMTGTANIPISSPSLASVEGKETVFSAGKSVPVTAPVSREDTAAVATASELVGMSCTIGSSGEVCGAFTVGFTLFSQQSNTPIMAHELFRSRMYMFRVSMLCCVPL